MHTSLHKAAAITAAALLMILMLAACATQARPAGPPAPTEAAAQPAPIGEAPDLAAARGAVTAFLGALHSGDYAAAAELYGGDYELLRGYNPGVSPDDGAALLEAACTANGFMCLQPVDMKIVGDGGDVLTFAVSYVQADGSPFVFTPPPGAEGEPRGEFPIRVQNGPGGARVLDLPPYVS